MNFEQIEGQGRSKERRCTRSAKTTILFQFFEAFSLSPAAESCIIHTFFSPEAVINACVPIFFFCLSSTQEQMNELRSKYMALLEENKDLQV